MISLPFSIEQATTLLLVAIRLSVLFFLLPFFDAKSIPIPVKISLLLILSAVLTFYGNIPLQSLHSFSIGTLIIILIQELFYGLSVALLINIFFYGIQSGMELVNIQIGFSTAQMVDPTSGVSSNVLTIFCSLVVTTLFFIGNGHYVLLKGITDSFTLLPVGGISFTYSFVESFLLYGKNIFIIALKIASPIITALFLVDLAISLIAKSIPTMNLMIFGFPIKIVAGFSILIIIIQFIAGEIPRFIPKILQFFQSITIQ